VNHSFDATVAAGVAGAIDEITAVTSSTECAAFGFATAHVNHNGCTDTFTTPTKVLSSPVTVTWGPSQYHIVCPAGKKREITPTTFGVSACTQFIGEQTPTSGHVVGKNAGGFPMDVTLEFTVSGIHYSGTGGLCGNSETHSDATLTGNSTVKCYKNLAHTEQIECTFS
jgi:hypothetical protein